MLSVRIYIYIYICMYVCGAQTPFLGARVVKHFAFKLSGKSLEGASGFCF